LPAAAEAVGVAGVAVCAIAANGSTQAKLTATAIFVIVDGDAVTREVMKLSF